MINEILKILNENSKGSDGEIYLDMPIGSTKGIQPDDFLHVAAEIDKLYKDKLKNEGN